MPPTEPHTLAELRALVKGRKPTHWLLCPYHQGGHRDVLQRLYEEVYESTADADLFYGLRARLPVGPSLYLALARRDRLSPRRLADFLIARYHLAESADHFEETLADSHLVCLVNPRRAAAFTARVCRVLDLDLVKDRLVGPAGRGY